MFTLIDTRTWYVIANYRESKIAHIRDGAPVDVYLMGHPDRKFNGVVESIGFGDGTNNPGIGEGRFMYLTPSWQAFDYTTWTDASVSGRCSYSFNRPTRATIMADEAPRPEPAGASL